MKKILIILLTAIFCLSCRETILHNLDELQANRVLVTLTSNAIHAEKIAEGTKWNISVLSDEVANALKVMEASRLLYRDLTRHTQEPKGLLASKEERISYLERQQAWNIEQTLETIPGVLEARVHFYIDEVSESDSMPRARHLSASALILTNGKETITEGQLRTIVAGASGTKPETISVIFSEQSPLKKTALQSNDASPQNDLLQGKPKSGWTDLKGLSNRVNILFISGGLLILVFMVFCRSMFHQKRSAMDKESEVLTDASKGQDVKSGKIEIDPLGTIHAYDINIDDLI